MSPESEDKAQYADWKAPTQDTSSESELALNPEPLQTEVTVDELVNNVSGGWDETMALQGVTKESAQKLLQEAYKAFDEAYENRENEDNSAQLDTLEKVIDLLRKKRSEPETAAAPEISKEPEALVEAEPQPQQAIEKSQDNVIDAKQEFTQRTQMNDALKGVRNLAFEMWGAHTALTQGNKILPLVRTALAEVRQKMQEIQAGRSMNSDIAETLGVLRYGIDNQRKEKKLKNPKGDLELDIALAEVERFIAEVKPPEVPKIVSTPETPTESAAS